MRCLRITQGHSQRKSAQTKTSNQAGATLSTPQLRRFPWQVSGTKVSLAQGWIRASLLSVQSTTAADKHQRARAPPSSLRKCATGCVKYLVWMEMYGCRLARSRSSRALKYVSAGCSSVLYLRDPTYESNTWRLLKQRSATISYTYVHTYMNISSEVHQQAELMCRRPTTHDTRKGFVSYALPQISIQSGWGWEDTFPLERIFLLDAPVLSITRCTHRTRCTIHLTRKCHVPVRL